MASRVTIVDVARAAGVSTSTASVALRGERGVSEATRERVAETAARLGYRVDHRARLLREHNPRAVGVTFSPAQSFHADVVEALYEAAAPAGVDLVLSAVTTSRGVADAVESLLRDRCSALVLVSPDVEGEVLAGWAASVPVVALASPLAVAGVATVATDERAGMALAVDHLVERGHREIVHLDGGDGVMTAQRAAGFRTAMRAHGLDPRVERGGTTEEAGIAAAERLLAAPTRPTAVVAYNDMAAIGLLLTLRASGIDVPGDLAVVGYDDTRTAALSTIGLTSVSQDPRALAEVALRRLATRADRDALRSSAVPGTSADPDRASDDATAEVGVVTIQPHLVARQTSGSSR